MMTEWHFVMMLVTWRPEESDSDRDKARSGPRTSPCPHNGPRSDSAMPALHQDTLASTRAQRNPPPSHWLQDPSGGLWLVCLSPGPAPMFTLTRSLNSESGSDPHKHFPSGSKPGRPVYPLLQRQISTFQCLLNSLLFKAQRLSLMNKIEPLISFFVNLLFTDSVNHFGLPACCTLMYFGAVFNIIHFASSFNSVSFPVRHHGEEKSGISGIDPDLW